MWHSPVSLPTQPVRLWACARRGPHAVTVHWSGFPVSRVAEPDIERAELP